MLPSRLLKRIIVDPLSCWVWQGCLNQGYGWTNWNKRYDRVHRIFYTVLVGPIPEDKEIHHLCKNRACCNPRHLEVVTRRTHRQLHPVKNPPTHCKHGHPFNGNNLVVRITPTHPTGQRQCRICLNEAMRRYHKKNSSGRPTGRPRKSLS